MRKEVRSLSMAFVVGTYRKTTLNQIEFLRKRGYSISKPVVKKPTQVDVFFFKLDKDKKMINDKFISFLSVYDVLIISGGETSSYILNRAKFRYLINYSCPLPLIGSGFVYGGKFHGKFVILKGGLTGGNDTYLRIIHFLNMNFQAKVSKAKEVLFNDE